MSFSQSCILWHFQPRSLAKAMVTSFYSAFADAVNLQDVGRDLGTNFNSKYQNYASASGGAMVHLLSP